jgi:uncharacterized protein YjbJ (UPF0337 family)
MSGTTDQIKGKAKQAAGVVAGDKKLEQEGKLDRLAGSIKKKAEGAVDRARSALKRRRG